MTIGALFFAMFSYIMMVACIIAVGVAIKRAGETSRLSKFCFWVFSAVIAGLCAVVCLIVNQVCILGIALLGFFSLA